MRPLVPKKNSSEKDIVMTPSLLAQDIIEHFRPEGRILDPCKGEGAFLIDEWCELSEGRDFFNYNDKVDWIITNPPWSKFKDFLSHSMDLSTNVVFLAPINHFVTKARLRLIKEKGFGIKEFYLVETPKEWPQSGFQIVAGHLVRNYKGPTYWKNRGDE